MRKLTDQVSRLRFAIHLLNDHVELTGTVSAHLCTTAVTVYKYICETFQCTWRQDLIHLIGF